MIVREMAADDELRVQELLAVSMGWRMNDDYAAYFRWKHRDNPFGPSLGWVAEEDGDVVGLRLFMRWEFTDGQRTHHAVRAVDTATHPNHRGKGIFRRLTLHGLEQLHMAGVDFVFNTPNKQSKPGYLKMGWQEIGHLPVALRVRTPLGLAKLARSRIPAERKAVPSAVGEPALSVFADHGSRLPVCQPTGGLTTPRTARFLCWRYGLDQLGYRVWVPSDDPAYGAICFRLRRRGKSIEMVVNDLLVPEEAEVKGLVGRLLHLTGADHALAIARPGSISASIPSRGFGPTLTWRGVNATNVPTLETWQLAMGDVELF